MYRDRHPPNAKRLFLFSVTLAYLSPVFNLAIPVFIRIFVAIASDALTRSASTALYLDMPFCP